MMNAGAGLRHMGIDVAIVNTTTEIAPIGTAKIVLVIVRLNLTHCLHLTGIASVRGILTLCTLASA
jgi:hypothetical protein